MVCEIISFAILLIYDWVIHRAVSQCRNACTVSNSYKQILFLIHSNSRKQPPLISNSLLSKNYTKIIILPNKTIRKSVLMCVSNHQTEEGSKVKVKLKSPDFTSVTQNSQLTNKPEAYGVLILLPSLYQCSVLRVFKAT